MRLLALLLALCALPGSAFAQEDARVAMLTVSGDARLTLHTALRTPQTILFPQGEQIIDVTVSDPAIYRPGVSMSGDSLVLVPESEIGFARMTVETLGGVYEFDLVPVQAGEAPLVVQVGGTELPVVAGGSQPQDVPPDTGQYRLRGDRAVQPAAISDDGTKTYLTWGEKQAMPAVFAIGPSGEEEMVEGYMRGGVYTIDRVYAELVFRIDKEKARAQRRREGGRR